jgi:uncharacterized protein YigE (DUF2233 family)
MAYAKTGYRIVPPAVYMPLYAQKLLTSFENTLEEMVAGAIEKMGRDNVRLTSLMPEAILQVNTPLLPTGSDQQRMMMHVLLKTLNAMGYIPEEIPLLAYRTDALLSIDECASHMCAARVKYYTREDVGGEYATLANLRQILPSQIKILAFAAVERALFVQRLRDMIGHIGWKIMNGASLTQNERTLFTAYCSTSEGQAGYSQFAKAQERIAAKEVSDPLVFEAFELYKTHTEAGPFFRFNQLLSDMNMERRTMYFGIVPLNVTSYTGVVEPFGPFRRPIMEAIETMKWSAADQMAGIADRADYFQRVIKGGERLAMKPARIITNQAEGSSGLPSVTLDPMDIELMLDNEADVAQFRWQYYSPWRQRMIGSGPNDLDLTDYLLDHGSQRAETGSTQIELSDVANVGFADFTHKSVADRKPLQPLTEGRLFETIYLPDESGRTLVEKRIDMTDLYVRKGEVMTQSAFGEVIQPPRSWYTAMDPAAVNFIAARQGLTMDEQKRFSLILSIAHNAARFTRLTGKAPGFSVKEYCANIGGYRV